MKLQADQFTTMSHKIEAKFRWSFIPVALAAGCVTYIVASFLTYTR